MLEKITDEAVIKLLKLMEIEIKDGKFIKTTTGEEFIQYDMEKTMRNGVFTYICGNTIVKVNTICPSDPIPCSVIVCEDGIDYCIYQTKSSKELEDNCYTVYVNNQNKNEYEIKIRPQFGENFIKTEIKSPYGKAKVNCSFDNNIVTDLLRYDSGGRWGQPFNYGEDLSLDNYEKLIKDMITYMFSTEPKLALAYLKLMPIIIDGYLGYVEFPKIFSTEYKKYYDLQKGYCNNSFAKEVCSALEKSNSNSPEKVENIISDCITFRTDVSIAMEKRNKRIALIEKQRDDFENYVELCYRKENPAKKQANPNRVLV